ncbi:MAG: FAD-dependent oxidoreductase, partial [Moorella sp. (in: Bacteria)]|nr:FAD-dependent oxidoreductase [Moorella sp. (in: firmicutes)]
FNFCQTSPFSPLSTSRPGVFVAGAFGGPCDVIDAVTQGAAAATTCATWLKENGAGLIRLQPSPPSPVPPGSSSRAGVFICECDALAASLDLDELEKYCRSLPGVDMVQRLSLCNSPAGEQLSQAINEHGLARVVAAACSARALEPVLRGHLARAGLPGEALRIVNILDHAARIYSGRTEFATKKAGDLVRMAVARVKAATPGISERVAVAPAALVLGGGAAGIVAALTLGDLGYEVHLVEKETRLGGNALLIHHTLKGADVQGWLAVQIRRLMQHPRIHVHLDAQILNTTGQPGSFRTEIEITGERREIITHGVTILATGAGEKKPRHYLYGQHQAVVTGLELEDLL